MNDLQLDEMFSVDPALADEPRQYLTRVDEFEVWTIQSAKEIAEDFEYSSYSGCGRPDVIMLLSRDGTPPVAVTAVIISNSADDDDYLYTIYELRDAEGAKYDRFTVKVDGKA